MIVEAIKGAAYILAMKSDICLALLIYSIWWHYMNNKNSSVNMNSYCIAMAIFWAVFLLR